MPHVNILEKGCRGCTLCADICPVDVFTIQEEQNLAKVVNPEDCIGCLSCYYVCPSQCIEVTDVELIRPYHRIEENVALVEQFLQIKSTTKSISEEEIDNAYGEVGILLSSFAEAISEIMGRGHKSVGRSAGKLAAKHLPEFYESTDLETLLELMKNRFGKFFDFNYTLSEGDAIDFKIQKCGLLPMVLNAGETPGKSDLCLVFHEYWAGLISAFIEKKCTWELESAGDECQLNVQTQKLS
jgi:NAD-dependent dihydropyrimidine dehydrogenase PreA subunit/predicted hydrocarbon binding protein